jgi:hypothetical protein
MFYAAITTLMGGEKAVVPEKVVLLSFRRISPCLALELVPGQDPPVHLKLETARLSKTGNGLLRFCNCTEPIRTGAWPIQPRAPSRLPPKCQRRIAQPWLKDPRRLEHSTSLLFLLLRISPALPAMRTAVREIIFNLVRLSFYLHTSVYFTLHTLQSSFPPLFMVH